MGGQDVYECLLSELRQSSVLTFDQPRFRENERWRGVGFLEKKKKRLFKLTQTNNQWRRSSEGFFLVSGGGGGATVDFSRGVQNNFFEEGTKDEISF